MFIFFIFIALMIVTTITGSDNSPNAIACSSSSPTRIISDTSVSFASQEEESELCDLALKRVSSPDVNLNGKVAPYLRNVLRRGDIQSDTVELSSVQVLRRLKSSDDLDDHESRYLNRLVMSAIKESLDSRDKQIEERWSRLESIGGMVITGLITAAISALGSAFGVKNNE